MADKLNLSTQVSYDISPDGTANIVDIKQVTNPTSNAIVVPGPFVQSIRSNAREITVACGQARLAHEQVAHEDTGQLVVRFAPESNSFTIPPGQSETFTIKYHVDAFASSFQNTLLVLTRSANIHYVFEPFSLNDVLLTYSFSSPFPNGIRSFVYNLFNTTTIYVSRKEHRVERKRGQIKVECSFKLDKRQATDLQIIVRWHRKKWVEWLIAAAVGVILKAVITFIARVMIQK